MRAGTYTSSRVDPVISRRQTVGGFAPDSNYTLPFHAWIEILQLSDNL